MDDPGSRDNVRHKPDPYRSVHAEWMIPQHQTKDHRSPQTIKLMATIAERDSALNERDLAISEKKTAQAERDVAVFQRDAAVAERNNAVIQRDNAMAALGYARENSIDGNAAHAGCTTPNGTRKLSHQHHQHVPSEDLNRQATTAEMAGDWRGQDVDGGDDLKDQVPIPKKHRKEWKAEDLGGLNEVVFDESSMPVPVCSCTGMYRPCYKWGNGGWQSACCTPTLSMYPLPMMPNKRHARVNGRKMSGTVFTKLLSRLASDGHDLSVPVDLKDQWSKHGTNRYITIK